jgi:hypothetical protein
MRTSPSADRIVQHPHPASSIQHPPARVSVPKTTPRGPPCDRRIGHVAWPTVNPKLIRRAFRYERRTRSADGFQTTPGPKSWSIGRMAVSNFIAMVEFISWSLRDRMKSVDRTQVNRGVRLRVFWLPPRKLTARDVNGT